MPNKSNTRPLLAITCETRTATYRLEICATSLLALITLALRIYAAFAATPH
jgi:hypothetical protein